MTPTSTTPMQGLAAIRHTLMTGLAHNAAIAALNEIEAAQVQGLPPGFVAVPPIDVLIAMHNAYWGTNFDGTCDHLFVRQAWEKVYRAARPAAAVPNPLSIPEVHQAIREAGGIVHGDGNIFFTRAEQFIVAAVLCGEKTAVQPPAAGEAQPIAEIFITGDDFDMGLIDPLNVKLPQGRSLLYLAASPSAGSAGEVPDEQMQAEARSAIRRWGYGRFADALRNAAMDAPSAVPQAQQEQKEQVHLAAPGTSVPAAASRGQAVGDGDSAPTEQETLSIDTGDFVRHIPSGESWVVAYVQDGRLSAAGWPDEVVPLSDCVLEQKATPEKRRNMLECLAGSSGHRAAYARAAIAKSEVSERPVAGAETMEQEGASSK